MDSLLYAILHTRNQYIDDYILNVDLDKLNIPVSVDVPLSSVPELFEVTKKIQTFLRKVQKTIHNGNIINSRVLRIAFKNHSHIRESMHEKFEKLNWISDPLSPYDVIGQINKIFSPPEVTTIREEVYTVIDPDDLGTAKLLENETKESIVSYVLNIHQNEITQFDTERKIYTNREAMTLSELINLRTVISRDDVPVTIEQRILVSTPILYVNLQRIAGQIVPQLKKKSGKIVPERIPLVKVTTTVIPDEVIRLADGKELHLVSIIIHQGSAYGGHYIAYIKCDDLWYYYNDMGFTQLIPKGTFDELIEEETRAIVENATGFFYV
jgi:hypothetical protein